MTISTLLRGFNGKWSRQHRMRSAEARRASFLNRPRVENLEDRRLLAILYVDNPADYTITNDQGGAGLDNGDTVTWDPGAGSQHAGPVTGLTFGTDAFGSIGAAITAATAGDTVRVGPGTFNEAVNVNKQLFVLGNQNGLDAQTRVGAPESIVDGGGGTLNVGVSDVVIDGFTIQGATNAATGFGITLTGGTSGSEIRNNIIQNNIAGLSLANNSAANQTVIEQNLFLTNNAPGPVSGTAIYTDQFNAGGALTNVLIDNNTFTSNNGPAVNLASTVAASQSNIIVSENIMTGNGNGVLFFNTTSSVITDNEIFGSAGSQIGIFDGSSGITITENFIEGGLARGIRIGDLGGGPNSNITINRNSIEGNAAAGLEIDAGGYTGGANSLNAEFNWWGSATGPTIASNPGGTGEEIVDLAGQVDYVPFLPNGVDTAPALRGFQPSVADLSITKDDAPDPAVPGSTLTYTILVTNNGPDTQTGATITDVFPAEFTSVIVTTTATGGATGNTAGTGDINDTVTMPPGSTITYTVTGTIDSAATGTLTNTATVTAPADTFETDLTNNSDTETTALAPEADLSVTKTDSPDPVVAGTNLTYTILVTNNGASDAQGVSLTDIIPADTTFVSFIAPAGWATSTPAVGGIGTVTATNATLAATDTATFTLVVAVNASTLDGSTVINTAAVTSTTPDIDLTNNADTETTDVDAAADLSVTKTDSPDPVIAGTNLTYTITVTNDGSSDAQVVSLTDVVPAGTTFVSFTAPAGWAAATPAVGGTGTVTATNPTVVAGTVDTFTLIVNVNSSTLDGTTLSNTAIVDSATTDPDRTDNADTESTDVDAAADLSVTKTDSPDPVIAGTNLTYTITVTNDGSSDAQGVSLTDVIPAGTTFVSFTAPAGWTPTTPAVGGTGTVTATNPTLAAGDVDTFTLVVNVNASTLDGTTLSNTSTVASTTTDPDPTDNSDTETTDVDAAADLSVTKTDSPDPVTAGQNLTYTIIVTNTGSSDAQGVSLTDVIPAGTTFVSFTAPASWAATTPAVGGTGTVTATNPTVAAGAVGTFTLVVNVNASTLDGATLSNTSTVASTTTDPDPTDNADTETTSVIAAADLSVTKTDSPDPVVAGTNLTYTILVTNSGSSDAQGVLLTDVVPAGTTFVSFTAPAGWTAATPAVGGTGTITATNPTVAAGASATFTLVVNVNATTLDGSIITNTSTVTSTTTDPDLTDNADTETTDVDAQADLSVTKTDSPDPVVAGTNLTYTIIVTNSGVSDAQGASLTDVIPAGTTFVSFTAPAGWTATTPAVGGTGTVTATNPTLAAGDADTFTLVVNVNASTLNGTTLTNTSAVTSTTTDPDPTDNADTETTTVNAAADLSVTKTDSPDPVTAGQNLTYTIVVTNNGSSDAQGVSLTDVVPANTTFVSFTTPAGWAATTPAVGGTGTVTATNPTLAAGGSATFTLVVNANASAPGGSSLTNTASVSSTTTDPTPGNNADTETTSVIAAADLSVTKSDSPDPVTAGQNLTYTILVTNNGSSDAQGVSLSDVVPANTTFVSFTAPAGWTTTTPAAGGTGTVTAIRSTLAAGGSGSFTLVVNVNASTLSGTTLTNTAAITSTTTDPAPANNADTETTAVIASADLSVTKTGTPSTVIAGENLTYTIVVTNNGVSDAQGVNLSDVIPTNTTFVSFTAPAGWTSTTPAVGGTGTVTSTLATLAAGSGPQTFTLVVQADATAPNGATITNTALVSATTTDPDPANNSASTSSTVDATADLVVTKSTTSTTVSPGQNLTYTIIVSNNGVTAAQDVFLSDVIPLDTTFVSFTAPAGWTTTTPPVGGTGLVVSDIPTLAPGSSATFTLVVRVDPTAADGTVISNTADVTTTTAETDDTNNTSTVDVDVTQAVLQDCEVTTLNVAGAPRSVILGDDPDNPGSNVLVVTGTSRNDVILIEQRPADASQVRVWINGEWRGIYPKSRIVAFGLAGHDTIIVAWNLEEDAKLFGDSGNDSLFGAAGKDGLDGGIGNDHLFGGWDTDTLCGGAGNDFLYGQFDDDVLGGEAGNDKLFGEGGNDQLQGGDGHDYLYGGIGNDRLFGQLGNDLLFGESGNDIAVGGAGNDRLYGGVGRDLLIGGTGDDTLYGESDDDILVANSTTHDENEVALMAILLEWTSSRSYSTRVSNIRNGGGANGAFTLSSATVLDDGRLDTLWGQGGQDWFLTGVNDRVRDKASNEQVN